jgi:hypothetical protein
MEKLWQRVHHQSLSNRAVNYDFLCHVKNRCGAGEKRELIPFGGGDRKRISLHRAPAISQPAARSSSQNQLLMADLID